jgi:uncharacterized protein
MRKKVLKKEKTKRHDISFQFLGRSSEWMSKRYTFSILAAVAVTILLMISAFNITWDEDYLSADPEGWKSIALMDTINNKFDLSIEYALILADDVKQSREFAEKSRDKGSVALTDDISLYLPSAEEQQKRIPHIYEVHDKMLSSKIRSDFRNNDLSTLKREIDRLQMNIMEMQDMAFLGGQDKVDKKAKTIVGDPDIPDSKNIIDEFLQTLENSNSQILTKLAKFQKSFAPYFKSSVVKMSSTAPIKLEDLPVTILDRYSNKTRDQFLVSVYPAGDLWQRDTMNRFVEDLEQVSDRATGSAPLGKALIDIFGRDGRNAIMLTLVIVFLLLWFDFQSAKAALAAMVPLALGMFWMVGFMNIFGMQLSIMNVMGLPMIVGIGIDDGVHIIHRWKSEGPGKIRTIFASTGKAIFLTTLTTMFAFGSLMFSEFPGWIQFGSALALGVGTCFLTTVVILPGILGWIEKKNNVS